MIRKWTYSFAVWPHEKGFSNELFELFEAIKCRVEMEFTEDGFRIFRSALERDGFTLREVERVPSCTPEPVN